MSVDIKIFEECISALRLKSESSKQKVINMLQLVPEFQSIANQEEHQKLFDQLSQTVSLTQYQAGEFIIKKNQPNESMFIILEGSVSEYIPKTPEEIRETDQLFVQIEQLQNYLLNVDPNFKLREKREKQLKEYLQIFEQFEDPIDYEIALSSSKIRSFFFRKDNLKVSLLKRLNKFTIGNVFGIREVSTKDTSIFARSYCQLAKLSNEVFERMFLSVKNAQVSKALLKGKWFTQENANSISLQNVSKCFREEIFKIKSHIFKEGDLCQNVYIVKQGVIQIQKFINTQSHQQLKYSQSNQTQDKNEIKSDISSLQVPKKDNLTKKIPVIISLIEMGQIFGLEDCVGTGTNFYHSYCVVAGSASTILYRAKLNDIVSILGINWLRDTALQCASRLKWINFRLDQIQKKVSSIQTVAIPVQQNLLVSKENNFTDTFDKKLFRPDPTMVKQKYKLDSPLVLITGDMNFEMTRQWVATSKNSQVNPKEKASVPEFPKSRDRSNFSSLVHFCIEEGSKQVKGHAYDELGQDISLINAQSLNPIQQTFESTKKCQILSKIVQTSFPMYEPEKIQSDSPEIKRVQEFSQNIHHIKRLKQRPLTSSKSLNLIRRSPSLSDILIDQSIAKQTHQYIRNDQEKNEKQLNRSCCSISLSSHKQSMISPSKSFIGNNSFHFKIVHPSKSMHTAQHLTSNQSKISTIPLKQKTTLGSPMNQRIIKQAICDIKPPNIPETNAITFESSPNLKFQNQVSSHSKHIHEFQVYNNGIPTIPITKMQNQLIGTKSSCVLHQISQKGTFFGEDKQKLQMKSHLESAQGSCMNLNQDYSPFNYEESQQNKLSQNSNNKKLNYTSKLQDRQKNLKNFLAFSNNSCEQIIEGMIKKRDESRNNLKSQLETMLKSMPNSFSRRSSAWTKNEEGYRSILNDGIKNLDNSIIEHQDLLNETIDQNQNNGISFIKPVTLNELKCFEGQQFFEEEDDQSEIKSSLSKSPGTSSHKRIIINKMNFNERSKSQSLKVVSFSTNEVQIKDEQLKHDKEYQIFSPFSNPEKNKICLSNNIGQEFIDNSTQIEFLSSLEKNSTNLSQIDSMFSAHKQQKENDLIEAVTKNINELIDENLEQELKLKQRKVNKSKTEVRFHLDQNHDDLPIDPINKESENQASDSSNIQGNVKSFIKARFPFRKTNTLDINTLIQLQNQGERSQVKVASRTEILENNDINKAIQIQEHKEGRKTLKKNFKNFLKFFKKPPIKV